MSNEITIQDVFHQFLPEYSETHLFSTEQHMAALCISKCRTAEMGANISECESCHKKYIHYNSCKNRHCPMCQGMEVDEWIDKQQENVLDVPYFHTVFTIPEELYSLVYSNQKLLYDA
ncbi:MAG: transposase zinc-binding domain-containing protein, partial [Tyzzerella sp.]|nr:transposase zinc-binding domain-containing protein [Tyzzerella sp.]